MSYLVLARKCRPKAFHEVIGQQHITQTLKNSIVSGRVAQSFLFTGPRGVGKTTTARILAKALNCPQVNEGEPCNSCHVCQEISQGSFVDVLEIDGASNNSVDDIRDLREKIRYLPTAGRRKIYIVDEVHMLSTAAFNALLKTLEEPPQHAVFIFATTEPHKIPATILSRCQRFDFKRLGPKEIAAALHDVAKAQGWQVPPSVLALIARSADGSMRDAQSILDQIISSSQGEINYDEVLYLLGMVKKDDIQAIWEAVFNRNPQAILSTLAKVLERGYDFRFFAEQLLHYLRDLMVCKTCPEPAPLLNLTEEEVEPLKRQSDLVSLEALQQYFHLLLQGIDQMRGSTHPRIILEMTLIRLARMEAVASFGEILERLAAMEDALSSQTLSSQIDSPLSQGILVKEAPCADRFEPKAAAPPANKPKAAPPPETDDPTSFKHSVSGSGSLAAASCNDQPMTSSSQPPSLSAEQKLSVMVERIKKRKPSLAMILRQATLEAIGEDTVTLSLPSVFLNTLTEESNRSILQAECQNAFGARWRLECRAREMVSTDKSLSSEEKEDCTSGEIDAIIKRYPIVSMILEMFSARMVQTEASFLRKDQLMTSEIGISDMVSSH